MGGHVIGSCLKWQIFRMTNIQCVLKIIAWLYGHKHGLRKPREEIAFTARPKIHSHSQIFRYGGSIFCLPHRPIFSDILDLCLHWVSVVRGHKCVSLSCQNFTAASLSFPHLVFSLISKFIERNRFSISANVIELLMTYCSCQTVVTKLTDNFRWMWSMKWFCTEKYIK